MECFQIFLNKSRFQLRASRQFQIIVLRQQRPQPLIENHYFGFTLQPLKEHMKNCFQLNSLWGGFYYSVAFIGASMVYNFDLADLLLSCTIFILLKMNHFTQHDLNRRLQLPLGFMTCRHNLQNVSFQFLEFRNRYGTYLSVCKM